MDTCLHHPSPPPAPTDDDLELRLAKAALSVLVLLWLLLPFLTASPGDVSSAEPGEAESSSFTARP